MQVALPELESATINLHRKVSADDFEAFCAENPSLRAELSAQGEIIIMPPPGGESSYQEFDVCIQLGNWARADRRGKAFGSSAAFVLPSGAVRAPDAAWVSNAKLESLTRPQRRKFLRLVPEFIVEVLSPSDRRTAAKLKMAEWMANGVALAWLIDGDAKTVTIHRPDIPPQKLKGISTLAADGPMDGFTLDLTDIWAGL